MVQASAKNLFSETDAKCVAKLVPDAEHLGVLLNQMQTPDIQVATASPALGFIHRKLENADLYFLANTGNVPLHTQIKFRSQYTVGEWLNADTGTSTAAIVDAPLSIDLAPYASRLLRLHPGTRSVAKVPHSRDKQEAVVKNISQDWQVQFNLPDHELSMHDLVSWSQEKETQLFSGVVTYRKSFDLPSIRKQSRLLLSFGEGKPTVEAAASEDHPGMHAQLDAPVRDAAVVFVNGKRAGSLWHPPYELDITSFVKPGNNSLEVRVANTAINKMAGEAQPDYRLLWERYGQRFSPQDMDQIAPLPSGILGPVRLIERNSE